VLLSSYVNIINAVRCVCPVPLMLLPLNVYTCCVTVAFMPAVVVAYNVDSDVYTPANVDVAPAS
jgi:hypothetical protein